MSCLVFCCIHTMYSVYSKKCILYLCIRVVGYTNTDCETNTGHLRVFTLYSVYSVRIQQNTRIQCEYTEYSVNTP